MQSDVEGLRLAVWLLLTMSAVYDCSLGIVPNYIIKGIFFGVLAGLPGFALLQGAEAGEWFRTLEFICVAEWAICARTLLAVFVLRPLWMWGVLGAGDIKLAAVYVGLSGLRQGGAGLAAGLLPAGIWACWRLARRGLWRKRLRCFTRYIRSAQLGITRGEWPGRYEAPADRREAGMAMAPFLLIGECFRLVMMKGG